MNIIGQPNPELERLNLENEAQSQIIAQKNKELAALSERVKWLEEHWPEPPLKPAWMQDLNFGSADSLRELVGGNRPIPSDANPNPPAQMGQPRAVEPELIKLAEYDPEELYGKKQGSRFWPRLAMWGIPVLMAAIILYELDIHGFLK